MKKKSKLITMALYLIISLAVIAVIVLRLKSNKETAQQKIYHYNKEQAITVQADTLHPEDIVDGHVYTGTFEPNRETRVSSEVQGKINSVLADLGSIVTRGQPLMQLDNSLLKLQLHSTEVQLEGLQDDVNRYTILTKADAVQGVQLEKAALGYKAAKVQKETLEEQISKTSIKAPFNGIVTAKLNDEGGFAAPGVPLLQITDITILKFTVNVAENDLHLFHLNQQYDISADVYPDISLPGKIIMIGSKANAGNSFPVQFQVKNTKNLDIKSGMFGKVNIKGKEPLKGIIIPSSAIMGEGGKAQVYLIKSGKAVLQNIEVSKAIENKSVISAGLQPGDILVTNGFINLYDGANIAIVNDH
ncbi:MAG: efflux RND transporter periplasmic adaptor subunit [Chitinophagaceae bacterium]|nr:efflux RND transporter periplasmic adaptor subunit [Chitinophagaceae bacterium]